MLGWDSSLLIAVKRVLCNIKGGIHMLTGLKGGSILSIFKDIFLKGMANITMNFVFIDVRMEILSFMFIFHVLVGS